MVSDLHSSTLSAQADTGRGLIHDPELEGRHLGPAHSHVAWGAVIAGALTAMALLALLASFAYAIGIPAYRGGAFGVGAGIWVIGSSIVAFLVGGCLASYLAPRYEQRAGGIVHGMLAWVVATVLIMTLSASAVGLFRGVVAADAYRLGIFPLSGEATHAEFVGAAWAAFLALFFGLISSVIGGVLSFFACRSAKI